MRTLLVIANQTIGNAELTAAVRERLAAGTRSVELLVPVGAPSPAIAAGLAAVESAALSVADLPDRHSMAEERLAAGLEWLRSLGAIAHGRVATGDVVDTVKALVAERGVDEVVVSTLPSRLSRWLRQDLPHRVSRSVTVPVTVITATGDHAVG